MTDAPGPGRRSDAAAPTEDVWMGRRFGPYQVTSFLGAGGMGEVYRARDTQLGRDVAIKILPRRFSDDPDRLTRFEREARALAALNHANIATIYGIEAHDDVRAIVMELYLALEGMLKAVSVTADPTSFRTRGVEPLLRAGRSTGIGGSRYDVTADGERFLVLVPLPGPSPRAVMVLINWVEALGQGAADAIRHSP